ncbi:unnamed protein product [Meganyctiphanes norvegica]|uniref:DM13 domain-containing protein n=1 Tax=Meganyctiphanes norvegica TaxID=48144 RepID=A0AAV2PWP2_MEGNR
MFLCNVLILFLLGLQSLVHSRRDRENGAIIGPLIDEGSHSVSGTVYAPSEDQIYIKGLYYDGEGPDAHFWIGESGRIPDTSGIILRYPRSNTSNNDDPLRLPRFAGEDVLLDLPEDKNITQFPWLSIWCREFSVSFAHVLIPRNLEVPQIYVLPEFSQVAHGVKSGNITILNARTIMISKMYYDELGPDAYFWVGTGSTPDASNGSKIPDEKGSLNVLKSYLGEDILLHLPENLTVYDINYFGVRCMELKMNFGYVAIPEDLWVPPALDIPTRNITSLENGQGSSTIALAMGITIGLLIIITIVFAIIKFRRRKHGVITDSD